MSAACVLLSPPQSRTTNSAPLLDIDSIARTVIDAHFAHAFTDRRYIAGISKLKAIDPLRNLRPCPQVP